ncbi:hypothetical protein GDO78_022878 [Eleutherodactylus coqui]|uniref:Uncharacterized protein n=1 Tax=Eleutherodactylus coqui TaxID=57060 RepID=A0A8J6BB13_ELECQ|nr:hypothetical protein GDO78_022878 [Eleutherodactylus coqui]
MQSQDNAPGVISCLCDILYCNHLVYNVRYIREGQKGGNLTSHTAYFHGFLHLSVAESEANANTNQCSKSEISQTSTELVRQPVNTYIGAYT